MFLGSTTRAQIVLTRLRRNGIRIAIDDFGSGYATLSYLRDLPVDEVKFDRAFIAPLLTDPRAASVVRAMIALAHDLGLAAVAEGIENVETAALLRDYGCDIGQGFHFSAPLTSADLLSFLAYGAATEPASAAARSS
jgi:EAL domain-containing protein (putative c-di-GMP-specific phosphodiesterase class I)